jgi:hypothetical protein
MGPFRVNGLARTAAENASLACLGPANFGHDDGFPWLMTLCLSGVRMSRVQVSFTRRVAINLVAIAVGFAYGIFCVAKTVSNKDAGYWVSIGAGAIFIVVGVWLIHHAS